MCLLMPYAIYKLSNKAGSTIIAKLDLSCFECCHIPEAHLEFTAEAYTFAKAQLSLDWFSLVHLSHGSNLKFFTLLCRCLSFCLDEATFSSTE